MPRAPRICSALNCRATAVTGWSQCAAHKPAPYAGAKDRWLAERPPGYNQLRSLIFKLQMQRCARCGSRTKLELDHIHPVAQGGSWAIENLQGLCRPCHDEKSQEDRRSG